MGQHRPDSAGELRRLGLGQRIQTPVADGIDTAVNDRQPPARDPAVDRPAAEPQLAQLQTHYMPVLTGSEDSCPTIDWQVLHHIRGELSNRPFTPTNRAPETPLLVRKPQPH